MAATKRVLVIGAKGGLGRNAFEAARDAGHEVAGLVRDPSQAPLGKDAVLVAGDATSIPDLERAMKRRDVALFCVNPPFSRWSEMFPPLLRACIAAAKSTGVRLVFPANVWIYGRGSPSDHIDEDRAPTPISERGRLRASMERELRESGIPFAMVRLPEFYGPYVVTLTALVVRAALEGRRAWWPGPLDHEIELVYMPDGARALVTVGCDDEAQGKVFHLPGARTTARAFAAKVFEACGHAPKITGVPTLALRTVGLFDASVRGAADVAHLWTHPILLDGTRYRARYGDVPVTDLDLGIAATLDWHRANPGLRLQG